MSVGKELKIPLSQNIFFLIINNITFLRTTTLILKNHCLREYVPFPRASHIFLALVYVLVTANLAFFIFYRKEREVKASSVSLSMCIFVANYLMLLSGTIYAVQIGLLPSIGIVRHISCNVDYISFSVGIDLAVATALVKTFRIWNIFHHVFSMLKKSWADSRLVLLILAIISIKLFLFVLWISVDNPRVIDTVIFQNTEVPPFYLVFQSCHCDYQAFWVVATCLYTCVLLILLFHLAVRTRKINYKDFKDTKKTILMVICQLIIIAIGGLLWGILRQAGQIIASYTSLILTYTVSVFVIQISLFLPKVLPPLWRHMKENIASHSSGE